MAEGRGIPLLTLRLDRGDRVPSSLDGVRGVVSMGGPMSVNDGFPWIGAEKAFLARAMTAGLPVAGVCLGAQLMASALGARVFPGAGPEVGFGQVALTAAAAQDPLLQGAGPALPVLHWHGETFDLPKGAALLASSPFTPHQAFRWGERAWGFQFHLEVTGEMLDCWVAEEAKDPGGLLRQEGAVEALRRGQGELHAKTLFHGALVFSHFLDMLRDSE